MKPDTDPIAEVLRTSNDAVVVVNGDGEIVLASKAAEELFGYEEGELDGQQVELLMPEAMRKAHE